MNCLDGTLEAEGSNAIFRGRARSEFGLRINLGPLAENLKTYLGAKVVLGVRPEWLAYAETGSAPGLIEAVVEVVEPTGSDNFVLLQASGETLMARFAPGVGTPGQQVGLVIDSNKTLLFDAMTEQRISR